MTSENFRAAVLSRRELSPSVNGFRFRVLGHRHYSWTAGQYLLLATDDAPDVWIPFSIASAEDRERPGELDLAISNVGSRELVSKLAVGVELSITAARGSFTYRPAPGAVLLIGIGTGLAPLRAILQGALAAGGADPVVLLFGARGEADLLWRDELEALSRAHSRFRFEPTLSLPGPGYAGRRGRVQDHLAEIVAPLRDVAAYVCGTKLMVDDCVRKLTGELSAELRAIASEAF